ncbi:caspase domain-containing protein [Hysterangium stoloniferum]|nr:caspase domain-containing protein [Hysterangium stoloniferum]
MAPLSPYSPTIPNKKKLFALLIGINEYLDKSIDCLHGAVADINLVAELLEKTYDLRCKKLFNAEATRRAIISQFHALETDGLIHKGDPILIYYAGHGDEFAEPDGWNWHPEYGKIQTIIPYDTIKKNGTEVHNMISDRGLYVMLESLAKRKGCNITVILDCCHSNSGARDLQEPEFACRRARTGGTLPQNQDRDIFNSTSAQSSHNYTYSESGSYVLLAACGHAQTAGEDRGYGRFTKALADTLERIGFEKVTYSELLKLLPILPDQNPHYQGKVPERFLFSLEKLDKFVIPVIKTKNNDLVLLAGSVQGVAERLVFEVRTIDGEILGKFKPINIQQEQATLDPAFESGSRDIFKSLERARAHLVEGELHNFKVHFSTSFTHDFVASVENATNYCITIVAEDAAADLLVCIENSAVAFTMRFPGLQYQQRLDIDTKNTSEEISGVLERAAGVHWHLCRESQDSSDLSIQFPRGAEQKEQNDSVLIEFFPVAAQANDPIRRPVERYQNLIQDGVIDILINPKKNNYGMKLTNNTSFNFYPYVYYINVKSLEIKHIHDISPIGVKGADSPLPSQGGEVAIGYGTIKRNSLTFRNPSSLPTRYGFFKIFLTTSALSTSPIALSPFTSVRRALYLEVDERWYSCLLNIVERTE